MQILLILIGLFILYLAFNVGSLVWKVHKGIKQFKENVGKMNTGSSPNTGRTTYTADGVTIIDHRDPSEVNKKIFAQDEGEYVDFKEE